MIGKNIPRRDGWAITLVVLTLASALAAPQAAFAGDRGKDKGKDTKVPIVIGTPIVTPDNPPPKKK